MATTLGGPIVAIIGPTASGKSDLALNLALKFDGEIVCADSRTIYRGMDIGTAKPTLQEREQVRHHLLDLIDPGESLSAAAFKALAEAVMADIWSRNKVPFLVGGSGLYVDAVLYQYKFPAAGDPVRRAELDAMGLEDLHEMLAVVDPDAFLRVDLSNRRRVIRAIETAGQARGKATELDPKVLLLGLSMNKEIAQQRIAQRVSKMLEKGFLQEVQGIAHTYGSNSQAMNVIGYRAFKDVVSGRKSIGDGAADFISGDMALYKKQMTWFKRNPDVQWIDASQAEPMVREFLARQV